MIYFWLSFSVGVNVLLLLFLMFTFDQKEYWKKKFQEELEQIYPIQWDYTKKKGWADNEAEEE